ncbi:MAG: NAD-dependent epimerase/dehydratase family protein [Gemmataceae bacterium]
MVTGATGLLGSHVAEQLRLRGYPVRAVVRPNADTSQLRSWGVECVEADLERPETLLPAVEQAAVVYHCAARVGDWGPRRLYQRAIVEAVGNLLIACQAGQVGRVVHVSSINVYGRTTPPPEGFDEDAPLGQRLWWWDYYCQAKIDAEQLVRASPRPWTILRPSWFYGPRDRNSFPRVVKAMRAGHVRIIGDGNNRLNILYVQDIADAVIRAGTTPAAAGRIYNLSSRGEVTQKEFLDALARVLGLPLVRQQISYSLAFTYAFLGEAWGRLRGHREPPAVTRYAVALVGRPTSYRTERAEKELGWCPQTHPYDGLRRTWEWYRPVLEGKT